MNTKEEPAVKHTRPIELSVAGLDMLDAIAASEEVTTRVLIEALMHFAISCARRPGSWEAQGFELRNYIGDEGFADTWFRSDEPEPGHLRDRAVEVLARWREVDAEIKRFEARNETPGPEAQAIYDESDRLCAELDDIETKDPRGRRLADDIDWRAQCAAPDQSQSQCHSKAGPASASELGSLKLASHQGSRDRGQ